MVQASFKPTNNEVLPWAGKNLNDSGPFSVIEKSSDKFDFAFNGLVFCSFVDLNLFPLLEFPIPYFSR